MPRFLPVAGAVFFCFSAVFLRLEPPLPIVPLPGAATHPSRAYFTAAALRNRSRITRAQLEAQLEEEDETRYRRDAKVHFGSPTGTNHLAARTKSPHVLVLTDVEGSASLRALPEFADVRSRLQEMQSVLVRHQTKRYELWEMGADALSLAQAFEEGACQPYGHTEPDTALANTLGSEVHSMLGAYGAEARRLLRVIADVERHRIQVRQDSLLVRALKEFSLSH